jgi:hypothetical protein
MLLLGKKGILRALCLLCLEGNEIPFVQAVEAWVVGLVLFFPFFPPKDNSILHQQSSRET